MGHSPICQILMQIRCRMSVVASPPCWINSPGTLSIPAAFPFFSALMAASTSLRRMGKSSSFDDSGPIRTLGSPRVSWLNSSEQYSVHLLMISSSSVRQFPSLSWIVLTFVCLCFVSSLTIGKAFLLLFLFRFSSISVHWASIHSFCLLHLLSDRFTHFSVFLGSIFCVLDFLQFSSLVT